MLRICGVTYDHSTNFGSCLQAYALQEAIRNTTVNGESCQYDLLPYTTFRGEKNANQSVVNKLKHLIIQTMKQKRRGKFRVFDKKYMHYADCHSKKDLPLLNDRYDAFVCGSDVIWNFTFTYGDETYFLNFTDKYKFSYAASFGKADIYDTPELNEPADDIYRRNISALDAVSVREDYAVAIAQQFTDKKVVQVCDPVFLLTDADWTHICEKEKVPKSPYIFAYSTHGKPVFYNFVDKIHKETGLPVVNVNWGVGDAIKKGSLKYPTPQHWLGLLKNAEYVVTNSFHATVFSTIFRKKFYSTIQGDKEVGSNIRIYEFLERMGLSDRLVNNSDARINYDAPDFTIAENKLSQERAYGMRFLQDNLDAAYTRSHGEN